MSYFAVRKATSIAVFRFIECAPPPGVAQSHPRKTHPWKTRRIRSGGEDTTCAGNSAARLRAWRIPGRDQEPLRVSSRTIEQTIASARADFRGKMQRSESA